MKQTLTFPEPHPIENMPIWARLILMKHRIPFQEFHHFIWDPYFGMESVFASLDAVDNRGYALTRDGQATYVPDIPF